MYQRKAIFVLVMQYLKKEHSNWGNTTLKLGFTLKLELQGEKNYRLTYFTFIKELTPNPGMTEQKVVLALCYPNVNDPFSSIA
jgi:hypothetical protein